MCSTFSKSILLLSLLAGTAAAGEPKAPEFRPQEVETKLGVGYAVLLDDMNGDKKLDIVVVDISQEAAVRITVRGDVIAEYIRQKGEGHQHESGADQPADLFSRYMKKRGIIFHASIQNIDLSLALSITNPAEHG